MKKKEYITPNVVTVELPKMPLMAGSPNGFNNAANTESNENANDGLGKSGGFWSDNEPENYEE